MFLPPPVPYDDGNKHCMTILDNQPIKSFDWHWPWENDPPYALSQSPGAYEHVWLSTGFMWQADIIHCMCVKSLALRDADHMDTGSYDWVSSGDLFLSHHGSCLWLWKTFGKSYVLLKIMMLYCFFKDILHLVILIQTKPLRGPCNMLCMAS